MQASTDATVPAVGETGGSPEGAEGVAAAADRAAAVRAALAMAEARDDAAAWVGGAHVLARFDAAKLDVLLPAEVFQRLSEGETLRGIAREKKFPVGRFTEWFMGEHGDLFDAALRVRADDLAHESLEIADAAVAETVQAARLQVDTRLKLASKCDRARYGEYMKVERREEVGVDAGLLGVAGDMLKRLGRAAVPVASQSGGRLPAPLGEAKPIELRQVGDAPSAAGDAPADSGLEDAVWRP